MSKKKYGETQTAVSSVAKSPPRDAFQREARQLKTLKKRFEKSARLTVQTTIDMGAILLSVKNKMGPRGGFIKWTREHFGSEDEAEKFMIIAVFAADYSANSRSTEPALWKRQLAVSTLYELARSKLPPETVDCILDRSGKKPTTQIIRLMTRKYQIQLAPGYNPDHPPTTAPAQSRSKRLRRRGLAGPDDPALQKVLELIDMACAIGEIETPPTVAEVVRAVREQEIELTISLARKLARFFNALGDELARDLPHSVPTDDAGIVQVDDDDEHDVPTPGHTRQ